MLNPLSPAEAYRRVEFDARVAGGGARDLTLLCYDRLDSALLRLLVADQRQDVAGRSKALTDSLAALSALHMGLDARHPLAEAFGRIFDAARGQLLSNIPAIDRAAVARVRQDFSDIAAALATA